MFKLLEMLSDTWDTAGIFWFYCLYKKIVNDSFPSKLGRLCKHPDVA